MPKFCKSKLNLIVCLSVGLFLVFSIPALAQVTVSDPVILDSDKVSTGMPGKWEENGFGECFYLLPGPEIPGDEEPVGPDFFSERPLQYLGNTCFGAGDPTIDFIFPGIDWRIYRGDPDEAAFAFTALPVIADAIQLKAQQDPGCLAGGVLNGPRGTTWDDGDSFTGVGIVPPMASELKVNFEGSLKLAYYFVNGEAPEIKGIKFEECRTQDFILTVFPSVGDPVTRTGTVAEYSMGKYVVFELDGLAGETLLRFETSPSDQDLCSGPPPGLGTACTSLDDIPGCDYVPGENDVLSGVFISECCPLEVTKVAEPDDVMCESGTDGDDSGTNGDPDPCLVPCEDTGTDGDFNDDFVCIAETVTYTITVTNTSSQGTLTDVTVIDDQLDILEIFDSLGPGESQEIIVEGVCLKEDLENTVEASAKLSDNTTCTAEATATVTVDPECIDTGTDGY